MYITNYRNKNIEQNLNIQTNQCQSSHQTNNLLLKSQAQQYTKYPKYLEPKQQKVHAQSMNKQEHII